jgi:hypothetical protein
VLALIESFSLNTEMANEVPNPDQNNEALTREVWESVAGFYKFVMEPERISAFGEALYRQAISPDDIEIESILADIDPEQSRRALELEEVLKKLHGCVVAFKIPERGKVVGEKATQIGDIAFIELIREHVEPEEQLLYVKDHVIDTDLARWMVGLSIIDLPVTKEKLAKRGWFIQPMDMVYDFRVVATNHHPFEGIE